MVKGRPHKPLALLKAEGTLRADRHGKALDLEFALPEPPDWLTPEGRPHWDAYLALLADIKVLTILDGPALGLLAETTAEWLALLAIGRESGRMFVVEKRSGIQVTAHPATAQAKMLAAEMHKMLSAFGLTPAARRNVEIAKDAEAAPAKEDFFSRRGRKAQ